MVRTALIASVLAFAAPVVADAQAPQVRQAQAVGRVDLLHAFTEQFLKGETPKGFFQP
jgi:hypothetical protein